MMEDISSTLVHLSTWIKKSSNQIKEERSPHSIQCRDHTASTNERNTENIATAVIAMAQIYCSHPRALASHPGQHRMCDPMSGDYYWPKMTQDE